LPWLPVAAALILGLISTFWYLSRPSPPPRITEFTQLTHDGSRKELVGTDGTRLYFNRAGQTIAQVAISGGEIAVVPVPLPGENLGVADVSPDGSTLLVRSNEPGLWSVRLPGGSLRRLSADGPVSSAGWSPDGKQVVYSTFDGNIGVVRSDGTGAHRLSAAEVHTENSFTWNLVWSPDGRTIRFDRDSKLYEMSADGSGLHPLLPGWRPAAAQCCGHWTPDRRFFLFLSWDAPLRSPSAMALPAQIWVLEERRRLLRRATPEPIQLTSGPIRWGSPVPSKDGKKIFARGVVPRGELGRYDSHSHRIEPYLAGISAEDVSFSRDGQFMAYVTFPEGILWKANRDGSNPVQLTDPPWYPTMPRWSPDGTQILFADLSSGLGMYLVSACQVPGHSLHFVSGHPLHLLASGEAEAGSAG
jgi:Tol biopolymer transport system component